MHDRSAVHRWLPAVFGLFLAAIVGFWAYDLGLSHAVAQQLPPPPAGVYPWAFYRPWGFGPFFPLFFLAFWFFVLRIFFFRGGPWRRGWRGYYHDRQGVPPVFEEWHRRAHERNNQPPSPQQP